MMACSLGADLINVFEVFLPQLLLYPNPTDPLNGEAAALMMRDREHYELKVKGASYFRLLAFCALKANITLLQSVGLVAFR